MGCYGNTLCLTVQYPESSAAMGLLNKLVLGVEGNGGAEWLVACPIQREAVARSARGCALCAARGLSVGDRRDSDCSMTVRTFNSIWVRKPPWPTQRSDHVLCLRVPAVTRDMERMVPDLVATYSWC